MLMEEIEVINCIRDMADNRENNCKCFIGDKKNTALYRAKLHLEFSVPNLNTCIYCRGLNLKFYRLNLEKALDSAKAENERVLNILRESIL